MLSGMRIYCQNDRINHSSTSFEENFFECHSKDDNENSDNVRIIRHRESDKSRFSEYDDKCID